MANENLMALRDGDETAALVVDMTTQNFGSGGSDYVPPGRWKVRFDVSEWRRKKDGTGVNWHVSLTVQEPAEYKGARLVRYIPAPLGDPESEDYQTRERQLKNALASVMSGLGKLEEVRQRNALEWKPGLFKGREAFVQTSVEEYRGELRASVDWFIPAEEFAARPGPDPFQAQADVATSKGGEEPELMGGGNGAGKTAPAPKTETKKDPMMDLLGG